MVSGLYSLTVKIKMADLITGANVLVVLLERLKNIIEYMVNLQIAAVLESKNYPKDC